MVLKQDKGGGVVVIDRKTYTGKCPNLLHTESFTQLDHDLTKAVEGKTQRSMGKIKNNLTKQEYSSFYPIIVKELVTVPFTPFSSEGLGICFLPHHYMSQIFHGQLPHK